MTISHSQTLEPTTAPMTLGDLVTEVLSRLGDLEEQIWTTAEAITHLQAGHQQIARLPVFWDWVYLENLPTGFSYTAAWEKADGHVAFDWGCANYTMDDERRVLDNERTRLGPGWYTCPMEATDGWLSSGGANTTIPATAELPTSLTGLLRATWDNRGIDAMTPALMQRVDARYQLTKGEVYGFMWQVDGIRTFRKVRVPAAQATTATVNGSWGVIRDPIDLSTATPVERGEPGFDSAGFDAGFFTDPDEGTLWGVPRRIPGHHVIGAGRFGAPRRPFLDGKNVRVEHARQGSPLEDLRDTCELPPRYARYLRDYAQARLLERAGPGQDLKLAQHFDQRWQRGLTRIANRLDRLDRTRTTVLGGDGQSLTTRPPRPSLPWAYGAELR